jgi:predicted site-specific integrase-resolvase
MTYEELMALPVSVDLPTAARALGIGSSTAYDLHRRGELGVSVQRYGSRLRVPRSELFRVLGVEIPGQRKTTE